MTDSYTYRTQWSPEDAAHVGFCVEFPSLSWLAGTPHQALSGIRGLVEDILTDMRANGEVPPRSLENA